VTTLYRSLTHTHTHTHTLYCSQSTRVSTSRFLATDFNTGTIIVSLNYTHIKPSLQRRTFNRALLQLTPFLRLPYRTESESCITTDGQSTNLSWNKAPILGLRPDFFTRRQLRVCWCGAFSLTRGRVCRLHLLLVLASALIFGTECRGTRDLILLSQIRDFLLRRFLRLTGLRWRYSTLSPQLLLAKGSEISFVSRQRPRNKKRNDVRC
jgi:hypothetical protein